MNNYYMVYDLRSYLAVESVIDDDSVLLVVQHDGSSVDGC